MSIPRIACVDHSSGDPNSGRVRRVSAVALALEALGLSIQISVIQPRRPVGGDIRH